ncbi:MAG: hypothetical protein MRECE_47c003 [Mycoplasmataceae bacterium CE_OT135]|nr:MAG: hypothetical protein MRECE_47c003 [Mycoplasmataceae bacterium CE_OT135]
MEKLKSIKEIAKSMFEEGSTALETLKQYYKINKRIINIKTNMTNLRLSAKTNEYEQLAEELKKLMIPMILFIRNNT